MILFKQKCNFINESVKSWFKYVNLPESKSSAKLNVWHRKKKNKLNNILSSQFAHFFCDFTVYVNQIHFAIYRCNPFIMHTYAVCFWCVKMMLWFWHFDYAVSNNGIPLNCELFTIWYRDTKWMVILDFDHHLPEIIEMKPRHKPQ